MITWITLVNSFLLGLVASFQPCLFPVLPTYVAFLTGQEASRTRAVFSGLLVTLGIMTVFVTLALLLQELIFFFAVNYLRFRTAQGVILVVLSLLLITGVTVHLPVLDRLSSSASSLIDRVENPHAVSYLIGLLFTLLAAPCAIVVFGTVFTLSAGQGTVGVVAVMALFSLGAGVPFLLIGGLLPSLRDHVMENRRDVQRKVTVATGVIVLLVGLYLTLDGLKVFQGLT